MIYEVLFAAALIGAPAYAISEVNSEPTSVETTTTEVVSEEVSSDDIVIADDIVEDEDFDFGEWFSEKFNGQTLALIATVIGLIASSLKIISISRERVTGAIHSLKTIDEHTNITVKTSVDNQIATKIVPLIEQNEKLNQSALDALNLVCKLLVAGQDQTPAGKAYYAELTQSIGKTFHDSKEFAEKISADLKDNIAKAKEVEEDITSKLDLIAEDEDLPVE